MQCSHGVESKQCRNCYPATGSIDPPYPGPTPPCEHGFYGACMDCAAGVGETTSEIRITNALTGGQKGSKAEAYAYIPVNPMAAVARVYGYGAQKYAARNWERGYDWSLSYSALQRHITSFWGGEDYDPETGEPHLAHAVFHCLALIEWMTTHPELDDRAKGTTNARLDSEAFDCVCRGGDCSCNRSS